MPQVSTVTASPKQTVTNDAVSIFQNYNSNAFKLKASDRSFSHSEPKTTHKMLNTPPSIASARIEVPNPAPVLSPCVCVGGGRGRNRKDALVLRTKKPFGQRVVRTPRLRHEGTKLGTRKSTMPGTQHAIWVHKGGPCLHTPLNGSHS